MMRALVMDFNQDEKVKNISNEYLFGQSILVAPVVNAQYTTEVIVKTNEDTGWNKKEDSDNPKNLEIDFSQKKSKKIYLPAGTQWYDFWTNIKYKGGQEIEKQTRIDEIPLYIRAGGIIPFGPKVQYADEKKWDNLEIRIYEGADGEFTLYEDEGDNYNYEKGKFATINFRWNDSKKLLTIEQQKGQFDGMIKQRKFKIVKVSTKPDKQNRDRAEFNKVVDYTGNTILVKL